MWLKYDSNMTQIWLKYDSDMTQMWLKYDSNMTQICQKLTNCHRNSNDYTRISFWRNGNIFLLFCYSGRNLARNLVNLFLTTWMHPTGIPFKQWRTTSSSGRRTSRWVKNRIMRITAIWKHRVISLFSDLFVMRLCNPRGIQWFIICNSE